MGKGRYRNLKIVWGGVAIAVGIAVFALSPSEAHYTHLLNKTTLSLNGDGLHMKVWPPQWQAKDGKMTTRFQNGVTAIYTLDPILQAKMYKFFKKYKVPYGVFVAIEPRTGRVRAMVEYSSKQPNAKGLALRATYPAASIFKLVTASAALEKHTVSEDTVIRYHGGFYDLSKRNWRDNPKRDNNEITFEDALAHSNNVAFAKVALRFLNTANLQTYAERFLFNRSIPFETPIQVSQATIKESEKSLAMTAAGFGEVGLSPLHAALIAAAIANDGKMMAPCVVESVFGPDGETLYTCQPRTQAMVIAPETAERLREMMALTITRGTSRKTFRSRDKSLQGMEIGGKTGSLMGKSPPGKYSWFVGMTPIQDAKIAVSALVINDPKRWRIRASQVAKEGLETYFGS